MDREGVVPRGGRRGERKCVKRMGQRAQGYDGYKYIRYARAGIVSPKFALTLVTGSFGSKGGSGYSRLRNVEFDTDSLLACSLVDGDEEPEERLRLSC